MTTLTRNSLLDLVAADPDLTRLLTHVRATLHGDPGHDVEHCLRVALWSLRLAPDLPRRPVVAAALLHDIVNVPKTSEHRARASELCADEARRLLPEYGFDPEEVSVIARSILDHSYSRGATPRSDLGRALQDADRLEALGILGVFRTISTGTKMGTHYFDPEDPWAKERALDDRRYSVDHFFTKLLLLPATFHTEAGKAEAERRAQRMRRLLSELGEELEIEN
jgi:uncharacterized protein